LIEAALIPGIRLQVFGGIRLVTSTASLRTFTSKDLAKLAKKQGVSGWASMRKDELIHAIVKATRKATPATRKASSKSARTVTASAKLRTTKLPGSKAGVRKPIGKAKTLAPKALAPKTTLSSRSIGAQRASSVSMSATPSTSSRKLVKSEVQKDRRRTPVVLRKLQRVAEQRQVLKDLARSSSLSAVAGEPGLPDSERRDRIVLLVRDPYWLQATWEVSRQSVERVRVSLAQHWHGAQPVLRVYLIDGANTTSTSESVLRDIPIHSGVNNWYIDVVNPPQCYRVAVGYKTANGKFHTVARSNKVHTPRPGSSDVIDDNWTDIAADCEKVYALSGGYQEDVAPQELKEVFEERLRRPMGAPVSSKFGNAAELERRGNHFPFEVDAEMVIYGATQANAHVTLAGEPVKLRADGTFTVRLSMPDKRQVLPVVASSSDGLEQRTTVLAIERNTKVMEPYCKESDANNA
jgi:uncharacterized protein